jgi:hypothetical protein
MSSHKIINIFLHSDFGAHWKGIETSFQMVPTSVKSFHLWVNYIYIYIYISLGTYNPGTFSPGTFSPGTFGPFTELYHFL